MFSTIRTFLKKVYLAWNADNPAQLAAALAYYGMFSFAPVIFIALTIAGIFIDELATADQLFLQLKDMLGPATAQLVQDIVVGASQRTSSGTTLISVISFGALLYAASGLFVQLQYALNTIWKAPPPSRNGTTVFITTRLVAFVMVIGVGLLLVLATVVSVAVSVLNSFVEWSGYVPIANFLFMMGFLTISLALMYKVLPNVKIAWRDVWVGAAVTALLLYVGGHLVGFYLTHSNIASAFEAAGALAVLLIAINYIAQIFLFGAVFTKVYASMFGSKATPTPAETRPGSS